eukprot:TRINITY_DN20888_c0_g1_i1.p1 TRINITY_DN20888_c0_g1~~TRINITY_DN20888_c0_g1_i1.p1  ORF type:complete len:460 (+),score=170.66 TRINITY_DN20888_c0_g1_i1:76-1380(+)
MLMFDPTVFFRWLLPSIIFTAGFNCRRKHFFDNIREILTFGVLGTMLNFGLIAILTREVRGACAVDLEDMEILALASILSATDSVAVLGVIDAGAYPSLFGMLSGEGVINDAIAIVLFRSLGDTISRLPKTSVGGVPVLPGFEWDTLTALSYQFSYAAVCSTVVGLVVGGAASALFHHLHKRGEEMHPKREIALLVVFAYISNFVAEYCDLSGIIALFVCGVMMAHYALHSLSEDARGSASLSLETLSFACETFLFISLGFYSTHYPAARWCPTFLLLLVCILVVARAATVTLCSLLLRLLGRHVGAKELAVLWWAGMIRGALAFALSFTVASKHGGVVASTTFGVVMITVFLFGGLSGTFITRLDIPTESTSPRVTPYGFWKRPSTLAEMFKRFDDKYMKQWLGGQMREPRRGMAAMSAPYLNAADRTDYNTL